MVWRWYNYKYTDCKSLIRSQKICNPFAFQKSLPLKSEKAIILIIASFKKKFLGE